MGGIPNPMNVNTKVSGSFGSIGPVTVSGIPDTFHINVDALPKIQVGLVVGAGVLMGGIGAWISVRSYLIR